MSFFLTTEDKTLRTLALAALLLLFGVFGSVEAQSGRRSPKSQPASSPTPPLPSVNTPDPSNTDSSSAIPLGGLQQRVKLKIGRQPTRKHLHSEDVILASFVKRLNQYANVSATSVGDLKHTEAVILAK